MFEKVKGYLHNKYLQVGCTAALAAGSLLPAAFAADAGTNAIVTAIESSATSLKSDAAPVIAAAVGVGIVFYGAKILWRNYKNISQS